jgi:hypothetical protein
MTRGFGALQDGDVLYLVLELAGASQAMPMPIPNQARPAYRFTVEI